MYIHKCVFVMMTWDECWIYKLKRKGNKGGQSDAV